MTNAMEHRAFIAAQIANYGLRLGLLPYQVNEAVFIGISLLEGGESGAKAYKAGREVVNSFAQNQIILHA